MRLKSSSPGAGRPTEEDMELRKERVLTVAANLFFEQGYAGTALTQIANVAKVAMRTIYVHIGGKEDVFFAVIAAYVNNDVFLPPPIAISDSLQDTLSRYVQNVIQYILSSSSVSIIRLIIGESNRFPDLLPRVTDSLLQRVITQTGELFHELERAGLIPVQQDARLIHVFVHAVFGSMLLDLTKVFAAKHEKSLHTEACIEMFVSSQFGMLRSQE